MKQLKGCFITEAPRIVEPLKSGREIILDQDDITMMMLEGYMEPESFDEVYNHSDIDSRTKLRSAIDKEFKKINVCRVWEKLVNLR
jgi:hypothetical protein